MLNTTMDNRSWLQLLLIGLILAGAGSLSAVPLKLEVEITASPLTPGEFRYDYTLTLDNNDNSWAAGQGWRYIIYSDAAAQAPASAQSLNSVAYISGPPSPWGTTNFGGSHTGPALNMSPNYWIPTALNETVQWTVDATNYLAPGELYWSAYSTTGGATSGNYIPVTILNPGLNVVENAGTSPLVLNNEDGAAAGYEAADFKIENNSSTDTLDVTSIEIEGRGNGAHASAYSEIAIYRDETGSGTVGSYDAGDVLIGTTATGLTGTPAAATFNVQSAEQSFAPSTSRQYFIVVKLNGTATTGDFFHYRISDMTVNLGSSTSLLGGIPTDDMNGFQILGDEVQLNSGVFVSGPEVVTPAQTDLPVGAFELEATSTSNQTITSISISRTGTVLDAEISAVKLWVDTNADGDIDTGESAIGGAQTFTAGVATFTGAPLLTVTQSTSTNIIVTYSFTGLATGTTMGYDITPSTDIVSSPGAPREVTPPTILDFSAALVDSFPYVQNFDAFPYSGVDPDNSIPLADGWSNDRNDGGLDWLPDYGGTSSSNSGPTADHTTGGAGINAKYLYVEDSSFSSASDPMSLITPPFDVSSLTAPIFEFWLHSTNNGNPNYENTLHFDLIDPATGNITLDHWTQFKGVLNAWTLQTLDLSTVTFSTFQIRFRVEATGSGFYNDMAIDDVRVWDPPDINVKNAANMTVGHMLTDAVGTVQTSVTTSLTYTIENNGTGDLVMGAAPAVTFSSHINVQAAATVLFTAPGSPVTGSSTTTFVVDFNPTAAGAFAFDISIASNDPDTPTYTFTVSGQGQSNAGPVVSIPMTGSNWTANAGNYELALDPGAIIADSLTATDPTPDNITVTVVPPVTMPNGVTTSPVTIGTPTAGPISLDWAGTLSGSNTPGNYVWDITVDDGISSIQFTATIIINDLPPTHVAGIDATGGNGQGNATAYTGSILVGGSLALSMADVTDPNGGQTPTFVSSTPDAGNPAGGSGFNLALTGGSIVATPASALVAADLGTHLFEVVVTDATNNTSVWVELEVTSPEIDLDRAATPIANNGSDTVAGALVNNASSLTYTVTNNGTSDLTITTVAINNQVSCLASVTANPSGTIAPLGTASLIIDVTPGIVGAFSFDFAISSDDLDEDPYTVSVSGTAAGAPEIDVSHGGSPIANGAAFAIGAITRNTSQTVTFTIDNLAGTSDLTISSVTTSNDIDCTTVITSTPVSPVSPGGSTTFDIDVGVTSAAAFSFTITIDNNDANETPYVIDITGMTSSTGGGNGSSSDGGGGCANVETAHGAMWALVLLCIGVAYLRRRKLA